MKTQYSNIVRTLNKTGVFYVNGTRCTQAAVMGGVLHVRAALCAFTPVPAFATFTDAFGNQIA